MIEFKAECGHTIRAKDEDEGKVVRCSYCGKDAQVPQDEQDGGLDFLFAEVERSGAQVAPPAKRGRSRRRRTSVAVPRREGDFDWMDATKKMVFFAVLIIAVVLVWKVVVPALTTSSRNPRLQPVAQPEEPPQDSNPSAPAYGLVHLPLDGQKSGLYVNSVPGGARVYVSKPANKDFAAVLKDPSIDRSVRTERVIPLEPGEYDVYVAFVINDPNLMSYPRYKEVRRAIESGSGAEKALDEFFLPDGAKETLTADLSDIRLIARKYKLTISEKQWSALVAMFVPDVPVADLVSYIPPRTAFRFDPAHVKAELAYYEVPLSDQRYVMDVLERIGTVIYRKPSGESYHEFSINLTEGWLSHKESRNRPTVVRSSGTGKKD